jgi:hypothetical protein
MTYDMKIQSDVSNILASNNVDYFIKVHNVYSVTSNLRSYEYKIYVRKKDYDKACYLIKDVFR